MNKTSQQEVSRRLRWADVYCEAELYKSAVRVYTKPLFQWRKALQISSDGRTLYDFAGRGLKALEGIHQQLRSQQFRFRPSIGLKYNFNGKRRTLYIPPWEERIVDLLLYRILNGRLHSWFSPNSYAYRDRTYGLDRCQSRIASVLRLADRPLFLIKRDISDYFASVDHAILLTQLARHIDPSDYLFELVTQRIRFDYQDETGSHRAEIGIPFGCASACVLANVFLTELDQSVEAIPQIHYFRYADDILVLSPKHDSAVYAAETINNGLNNLRLSAKQSRAADLLLCGEDASEDAHFTAATAFRHLGLEFRWGGEVSLSRDKRRKIQNLFRFAFRRTRRRWNRMNDPAERAHTLAAIASETIGKGVRNVAIIDYYLKHVTDTDQLRLLDRWLAEEILSLVFGGHRKGNFTKISFAELRSFGLPSLVHRRRLILHRKIDSPFFIWQQHKLGRAFKGTVANQVRATSAAPDFSPCPEAAAQEKSVGEDGRLYMGVME